MQYILDQLIICAGQWQKFGGEHYQREFSVLLNQLARVAGTTLEGAVELLMKDLEGSAVA